MSEIEFIVDKLNEPPFSKDLRLVTFDEKTPSELSQILREICSVIDPQQTSDQSESEDAGSNCMLSFLVMLKFPVPNHQREDVRLGLAAGDKSVLYPVMHWCLERLPQLKKRAYLARYLMPVEVPAEFMQDQALLDLSESYKEMQAEFKTTHKQVDQVRGNELRPGELRTEIGQLEDEKKQLAEKIEKLKANVTDEPGFAEMLEVTSQLRKAQEEDADLASKSAQQKTALQQAETRAEDARRRLGMLRQGAASATTAMAVLGQLRRDVLTLERKLSQVLPAEHGQKVRRLEQLEKEAAEPQRSREDVEEMEQLEYQLQRENEDIKQQIQKAIAERPDSNLSMLRQPAALATKKLMEKEREYETLQDEKVRVSREVETKEAKLDSLTGRGRAGAGDEHAGMLMSKEELRRYGAQLREKTQVYLRLKEELAAFRAESVVLTRTEQILKSRDQNIDEFLEQMEVKKKIMAQSGRSHGEQRPGGQADEAKGQTLEELSALVNSLTHELKARKERLRPMIEDLKVVRKECGEVDAEYQQKKGAHEKVAVGLEVERQQLEHECNGSQEDALREESRYHSLVSLLSIAEARVQRVRQEERWEKGDGRLLPEFQCYRDLYEHKLRQQEAMSKQLRRQQRSIKEDEAESTKQRKMYASLRALLRCKLDIAGKSNADGEQRDGTGDLFGGFSGAGGDGGRQGNGGITAGAGKAGSGGMLAGIAGRRAGGAGGVGAGAGAGVDEVYLKAVEAQASSAFRKGPRHGGAPDIMTLDRD